MRKKGSKNTEPDHRERPMDRPNIGMSLETVQTGMAQQGIWSIARRAIVDLYGSNQQPAIQDPCPIGWDSMQQTLILAIAQK